MKVYIYALFDPRDGEIRYVGKTDDLCRRYAHHLCPAYYKRGHKKFKWIQSLERRQLTPRLLVLQECDESTWIEAERWWIWHLRREGNRLTNMTAGGDGTWGYRHSPESKQKMSVIAKGKKRAPRTPEYFETLRQRLTEQNKSPEMRAKVSAHHSGKAKSDETREKLRQANKGRTKRPGEIEALWRVPLNGREDIRARRKQGARAVDLASEYGVSVGTINNILHESP
jgi:hypothetical protein